MVSPASRGAGLLAALALALVPALGAAPPGGPGPVDGGGSGGLLGMGPPLPEGRPSTGLLEDAARPGSAAPPADRLAPRPAPLVYTPEAPAVDPRTGLPSAADRDALFDLPDDGFLHVYAAARALDLDLLEQRVEELPGGATPAPDSPKDRALAALARVGEAHRYVLRDGQDALKGLYAFPWLYAQRIVAARETLLLRGRMLHGALQALQLATADALLPG